VIIRMLWNMSAGRHDGRVWPPAGADFEVPDWEGEDLVNGGNAIKVADSAEAETDAPLEDLKSAAVEYAESETASEPEPETEPEPEAEAEADDEDEDDDGGEVGDGPPKPAAPKQDWVDWAVHQGAEWVTATNSTKQQLMEQYGQRP